MSWKKWGNNYQTPKNFFKLVDESLPFTLQIEKIKIGHDGKNPGSGWFLDEVRIDVPSKGENYIFACHRWLDTKEEDGLLEVELEPTDYRKGSASMFPINPFFSILVF